MKRSGRPDRCIWDGDCDRCGWAFCIATPSQASAFYRREEEESRRRYGRGLADGRGAHKLTNAERELVKQEIRDGGDIVEIAMRHSIATETVRYYRRQIRNDQSR